LDDESVVLAGKEVRVEKRVVFRLDLPNRKTVGVKAKPGKLLCEILRPILHKYGYKLELVTLCLVSIITIISFAQGVYTYIPETNHVPREYSVSAVL
jgi:regulator of G-protein signaling